MAERSKQLHNFDLPPELRWGRQRYLKCMNVVNPVRAMPVIDVDESSDSGEDNNNRTVENPPAKPEEFDSPPRKRSLDNPRRRLMPTDPVEKTVSEKENEISATREKLMMEYQTSISKLRESIRKTKFSDEDSPPIKASRSPFEGEPSSQPVNLRSKLKSACNMPPPPPLAPRAVGVDDDPGSEKRSARARRNLEKKEERPKFSITLSRKEIEEDFLAMTGKKPPRKPNKRPKNVQMALNALFPGSMLSEVHEDRYKVNENGKN